MTMTSPTPLPPANWYPDPSGSGQYRYWDGVGWTMHLSPQPLPDGRPPAWNAPVTGPMVAGARSAVGNTLSNWAIVCGVVALLIAPIILGPIGLVLASKGKKQGEPRAGTASTVALLGMLGGFAVGCLVLANAGSPTP